MRTAALPILALMLIAVGVAFAGPINPPAGPVAPTPGPEPRIAINATNTPGGATALYIISTPGSYYLTENVQGVADKSGIIINASGVSIDLNGFSIVGPGGVTLPSSGITFFGGPSFIDIRNGMIRNWSASGIDVVGCTNCNIRDIIAVNNTNYGIRGGLAATIERCTVRGPTTRGIASNAASIIADCHVTNCTTGIELNGSCLLRDTVVYGATTCVQCAGANVVRNCSLRASTSGIASGTGIATDSFDNRFEGNHITFAATGISLASTGNIVVRNSIHKATTPIANAAGNIVAPTITSATIGANTNPDANYHAP